MTDVAEDSFMFRERVSRDLTDDCREQDVVCVSRRRSRRKSPQDSHSLTPSGGEASYDQ
jgi:hypothetical protein